jgi:NADP-dependent 3-hydroxy acid dehydrogenase YdfG
MAVRCDVIDIAQIEDLARKVHDEWGGVDLLVNTAGVSAAGFVGTTPLDKWKWITEINMWGVIHGCHVFIPRMKEQGSGHIVNVASIAGITSLPEMAAYNMTKAAIISLSETLRGELSADNIGVTAVCPSFFSSNLIESMHFDSDENYQMTRFLFDTASKDADDIAGHVIKAVEKNRLYVMPQLDAKLGWYAKRFLPNLYFAVISFSYRHGLKRWILRRIAAYYAKKEKK